MEIISEVTVTWPDVPTPLWWAAGPAPLGGRTSPMVRGGTCPVKGHPAGRRPDPALTGPLAPIQFPTPGDAEGLSTRATPGRALRDTSVGLLS